MVSYSKVISNEHAGDCYCYPVPSMDADTLKAGGKTAVIIGAGPGGLIAALTLKDIGYENVVVFEKRDRFSRINVINLHPESQHVLKRLNLLDRFVERASLITDHRNHVCYNGAEIYSFNDLSDELAINPDQPFDAEDVLNGFRNETLYSISIADLQDFLAEISCERGVKVIGQAETSLESNQDGVYSVKATVGDDKKNFFIDSPALILLADGGNSETFRALGGRYLLKESLWPNESWIFGHYQCNPEYGFCNLLFEFYEEYENLTISNCIFLPKKNEVNIAVTVNNTAIPDWRIKEIISQQAIKILKASGVGSSKNEIVWYSNRPVRIMPKTADRCHFGKNVILMGDAVGTNSPVAAFGGTLCTSAYSYALRELVKDLDLFDQEAALERYSRRAQAYVQRWHDRVREISGKINLDIQKKTQRLVAASSHRKETNREHILSK